MSVYPSAIGYQFLEPFLGKIMLISSQKMDRRWTLKQSNVDVKQATLCVMHTMFMANLHETRLYQKLPEGTALHNVCDILHVQLISDVWFVTAISVHGLRVCHPGELLRKLHPHHLNHCKHGYVQYTIASESVLASNFHAHASRSESCASHYQEELHSGSTSMCHALFACLI